MRAKKKEENILDEDYAVDGQMDMFTYLAGVTEKTEEEPEKKTGEKVTAPDVPKKRRVGKAPATSKKTKDAPKAHVTPETKADAPAAKEAALSGKEEPKRTKKKERANVFIISGSRVLPAKVVEDHGFSVNDKNSVTLTCRCGKFFVPKIAVYGTKEEAEADLAFFNGETEERRIR